MRRPRQLSPVPAVMFVVAASVLPATASGAAIDPTGGCPDGAGVSVVVDFRGLGGEVEVRCAEGDPETGRDALLGAGFTATDDSHGMICAIDALPDPCPAEFTGLYWSYWSAAGDGDWTAHVEGADSTDPDPGDLEGWRYNDGSVGPGVDPAAVLAAQAAATADAASLGARQDPGAASPGARQDPAGATEDPEIEESTATATIVGIGLLAVLLAATAALLVRRRRV